MSTCGDVDGIEGDRSRIQDEYRKIHDLIPTALSQWQWVEEHLFLIFNEVLSSKNPLVGPSIFHNAGGFRTQLKITDAVIQAADPPPHLLRKWKSLYARLSKKVRKRNIIAHGRIGTIAQVRNGKTIQMAYLAPFGFASIGSPKSPLSRGQSLNLVQLRGTVSTFSELGKDLKAFRQELEHVLADELD